jgi:DeoR/GlpR family transcriptional regulator of sugar metabolism
VEELLPEKRRELIADRLRSVGSVDVATLQREFGVSSMTARRDLQVLEGAGRAQRIHGGAVAPGPPRREDPFRTRLAQNVGAKERLGETVRAFVAEGETVFVDGSTTAYLALRSLLAAGRHLTAITNSVPAMELVASTDVPDATLIGIGGALRKQTRSFVGSTATDAIGRHFADKLIFSVQGLGGDRLFDADPLERNVKRAMLRQARDALLLLDASKLTRAGDHEIGPVAAASTVIVDGGSHEELVALEATGATVRSTADLRNAV